MIKEIIDIQEIYQRDSERNIFKKYIEYIRFPHLKNFKKDLKIDFNFPITFLVGPNGTGKSSLLQALYGSPKGKSLSKYWFNTELDPINDKHFLIYSYKTEFSKTQVEVIKLRMKKNNKPDYWEPARPNKSFNMADLPNTTDSREASSTRWNQIEKEVLYSDFRYELSAYDKYFYFGTRPNTMTMKTQQDLIRYYAPRLKKSYTENIQTSYRTRKSGIPYTLSNDEIKIVSYILGKDYINIKILEHDFYNKMQGFSIFYKTKLNLSYSEAFAGSGETAIIKLVHEIFSTKPYSLVLLDEPETSLHPAAQKKLIKFILEQIKKNKLQVVISTHSPDLIEGMPKESIKVLYTIPETGKIDIVDNVIPEEAFYHIGHSVSDKKVIIVEDHLAKQILDKAIDKIGGDALRNMFNIKFFPGGESRIKQEFMSVYSKEKDGKHFIAFDGDMKKEKIDIRNLSDNEKSITNLKGIIKNITQENIEFSIDSGTIEAKNRQTIKLMLDYIKYHHDNVFFLPKDIPEEIIWNNDVFEKIDIERHEKAEIDTIISQLNNENKTYIYKSAYNKLAKFMFEDDTSSGQNKVYQYFIVRWLKKNDESYNAIKNLIMEINDK